MNELEHVAPRGDVTTTARQRWAPQDVARIRQTVAKNATTEQVAMFLELAARYQLDPFAREIWCAVPNKNGAPDPERTLIMVGRDGWLKIADRHPDFRGMRSAPVYDADDFEVEELEDGGVKVTHKRKPAAKDRGELLGAWALVRREGRTPTFFFAALSEFKPTNPNQYTPWFGMPSLMVQKAAETHALRRAFSISGLYGEADEARFLEAGTPAKVGPAEVEAGSGPDWGDDPVIAQHLRNLVRALNHVSPVEPYPPTRVRTLLLDTDDEQRRGLVERLEGELRKTGHEPPPLPEPPEPAAPAPEPEPEAEAEAVAEEVVEDAEFVGEQGTLEADHAGS